MLHTLDTQNNAKNKTKQSNKQTNNNNNKKQQPQIALDACPVNVYYRLPANIIVLFLLLLPVNIVVLFLLFK